MKQKPAPALLLLLALWSAVSIGIYFFAVSVGFEPILPIYLILAFLSTFIYLLLQSPAVEIRGKEEPNRKRRGLFSLREETHRRLSRGILVFALPLFLAFLADYLLILLDLEGILSGLK